MGTIMWLDAETTGLDFYEDFLLELAVVFTTDRQFTEIARKSWIVQPRDRAKALARIEANERVLEMHTANGLYEAVRKGEGTPRAEVSDELCAMIDQFHNGRGGIPYGGSGVERFDFNLLAVQMPRVHAKMTYWGYDVGSMRRIAQLGGVRSPDEFRVARTGNHRAMDDLLQHIAEVHWFARWFSSAKAEGIAKDLSREDFLAGEGAE